VISIESDDETKEQKESGIKQLTKKPVLPSRTGFIQERLISDDATPNIAICIDLSKKKGLRSSESQKQIGHFFSRKKN